MRDTGDDTRFRAFDYFGSDARELLERKGLGRSIEPGQRPAVVVIDLSKGFTDPETPVGSDLESVVEATAQVLAAARSKNVPVFFFSIGFMPDLSDGGVMLLKQPAGRVMVLGSPLIEIDERLAPRPNEPVVIKKAASCFFGTSLPAMLVSRGIDTLILCGCSTSGCIRATAVDGYSYGYRLLVPRDCVGDRTPQAHEANLFDIQVKMGEVVDKSEVVAYLDALPTQSACSADGR